MHLPFRFRRCSYKQVLPGRGQGYTIIELRLAIVFTRLGGLLKFDDADRANPSNRPFARPIRCACGKKNPNRGRTFEPPQRLKSINCRSLLIFFGRLMNCLLKRFLRFTLLIAAYTLIVSPLMGSDDGYIALQDSNPIAPTSQQENDRKKIEVADGKRQEHPKKMRLTAAMLHHTDNSKPLINESRLLKSAESGHWDKAALSEMGLTLMNSFDVEIIENQKSTLNLGQQKHVPRGKSQIGGGRTVTNYGQIAVGSTLEAYTTNNERKIQLDMKYESSFYVANQEDPNIGGDLFEVSIVQSQIFDGSETKQTKFSRQNQTFVLVTRLVPISK